MEQTNEYQSIMMAVSRYEALGAYRLTITATIDETLKSIDKQRKDAKEKTERAFTACPDRVTAVNLANMLCPSGQDGAKMDDATRKRLSRRRAFLVNVLSSCFPHYDFTIKKQGRNGGEIVAEYVGDAATREANSMLATLDRLFTLLDGEKPEVNRDMLAAAIRLKKQTGGAVTVDPLQNTVTTAYKDVKAEFAGMTDHIVTADETTAVKEEKSAVATAAAAKAAAVATAAAAAADNYTAAIDEMNVPTTKAGKKEVARLEKAAAVATTAAING